MHGEFKVPGGKLVVVDLDVVDGRISGFRLAGDFFLEPDEALGAIDAAVNGLLAETDARTLAAAVQAALPADAQLLGFTPESVATAIRRALQKATSWRDYEWQLVHPGPLSPLMHLALDEVLAQEVGDGTRNRRCASGNGTSAPSSSAASSRSRTRWIPRTPRSTASRSCGGSRAAARCSWTPARS